MCTTTRKFSAVPGTTTTKVHLTTTAKALTKSYDKTTVLVDDPHSQAKFQNHISPIVNCRSAKENVQSHRIPFKWTITVIPIRVSSVQTSHSFTTAGFHPATPLAFSNPKSPFSTNPPPVPYKDNGRLPPAKRMLRHRTLLKNRVRPNWIAKKVLGQGFEVIVGWFKYTSTNVQENRLKTVAVKQGLKSSGCSFGLLKETMMYDRFKKR